MVHPIYSAAAEHHVSDPVLIDAAVLAYESLTEGHHEPNEAVAAYVADVVVLVAQAAGAQKMAHLAIIPHMLARGDAVTAELARTLTAERFSGGSL